MAEAKRQAIHDSIPKEWRLPSIPSAEEQKDVTGPYVRQFLTSAEVEITETDAVNIASKIASGTWSAVDVTKAFCHRASIAHQLVSNCDKRIVPLLIIIVKLSTRNILRSSHCRCKSSGQLLRPTPKDHWSFAWSSCLFERPVSCQECRHHNGLRWLD